MLDVSCIVPTHNRWPKLGNAIRSIQAQQDVCCEIIVVDDGSTDETRTLGPGLPGIRYVRTEGRGAAGARNEGIRHARHPWVAFLDHDDSWVPGKLCTQLAWMVANQHVCSCSAYLAISDSGQADLRCGAPEGPISWGNMLRDCTVCTSTVVVRRDVLQEVGFFDETLVIAEDWDPFLRLADRAGFAYHSQPLTMYLADSLSGPRLTQRQELSWRCGLAVQERYFGRRRLGWREGWAVRVTMADKHLRLAAATGHRRHLWNALKLHPVYCLRHWVSAIRTPAGKSSGR